MLQLPGVKTKLFSDDYDVKEVSFSHARRRSAQTTWKSRGEANDARFGARFVDIVSTCGTEPRGYVSVTSVAKTGNCMASYCKFTLNQMPWFPVVDERFDWLRTRMSTRRFVTGSRFHSRTSPLAPSPCVSAASTRRQGESSASR